MTLIALVRTVMAEFPDATPHKLAQLVAERTDPVDLCNFYATALESYVADRVRLSRNTTLNSKQGRSAKQEQRREWWAQMLVEKVHIGSGVWKPLGQCGVDDLDFCIAEREQQISKLSSQIQKYQMIRDAVVSHGVDTVADLPAGSVQL